jgi:hypothetical protein
MTYIDCMGADGPLLPCWNTGWTESLCVVKNKAIPGEGGEEKCWGGRPTGKIPL